MSGVEYSKWIKILSEENVSYKTQKYIDTVALVRKYYYLFYYNGQFLRLKCRTLCEILETDDVNVESEEMVFESVRRWLNSNPSEREKSLRRLLRVVRLPLLRLEYLYDAVQPFLLKYPVEQFKDACQNVIQNYKPVERLSGMLLRQSQTLNLEEDLMGSWEFESDPMKLLLIGSDNFKNTNVVEIFDDNPEEWFKPKNNLAIRRINYSVAFVNDKVLIIGGTNSSGENAKPLNMVQSLDLKTGILNDESPLNDARQHAAAVVIGDGILSYVYVLGGRGETADLDSVELWEPVIRKWTKSTSDQQQNKSAVRTMPTKRNGLAAVALNEKIYILGGKINDKYTNTMEAYDITEKIWETKAPMKETRAHFCAAAYQGCLYAVAGSQSDQVHVNTVEKYNPSNDSWVTIANITATGHVAVSQCRNSLICAGGKNSTSVLKYDMSNDKWHMLTNIDLPRSGFLIQLPTMFNKLQFDWVDQRQLLMIGTRDSDDSDTGNKLLQTACSLEVYDTRIKQWTILNDLNIDKINYSVVCDDNKLLMIGGNLNKYQLNAVKTFNLRTGKVSQFEPINYHRQNSAAAFVKRRNLKFIFVFGGMKDEVLLTSVEKWDSLQDKWTMMTPMSIARAGHGAALLNNQIYVVGGKTKNGAYDKTMEAYDYINDRWIPKASMKNPNAYFGITTFKNCIYVAGGNWDSATPVSTVERYNPADDSWSTIANISSRGMVGILGTSNRLICAGGKSSNFVEEYDESESRWRKLNPLHRQCSGFLIELKPDIEIYSDDWIIQKRPRKRLIVIPQDQNSFTVKIFDIAERKQTGMKSFGIKGIFFSSIIMFNKLLIIGGLNPKSHLRITNSVYAIDLSSGAIQSFPPLKYARYRASSVMVTDGENTSLYVLGGCFNYTEALSSVEKWDSSTNKWTECTSMTTARFGHGSVFLDGNIYAIGGNINNKDSLNTVEVFNVQENSWKKKTSMEFNRKEFGIAVYKNQIYVVGGYHSVVDLSFVERYDPTADTWEILDKIQSSGWVNLFTLEDRLICAGTDNESSFIEEYDITEDKWTEFQPMKNFNVEGVILKLPENATPENWMD